MPLSWCSSMWQWIIHFSWIVGDEGDAHAVVGVHDDRVAPIGSPGFSAFQNPEMMTVHMHRVWEGRAIWKCQHHGPPARDRKERRTIVTRGCDARERPDSLLRASP